MIIVDKTETKFVKSRKKIMPVKKCLILSVDKWLKLFACYNVDTRSILIGRHQRREREKGERERDI